MAAGADRSSMLAKLAKGFSVQGRNAMSKKGTFDAFDESTWTDGERRYFKIIDDALANGDDMQISNGKPQHAVYLLAKFLENASHSINMFSGRLSRYLDDGSVPAFADPHVLASARGFLERDATLRVVLEGEPDVGPGTQDPERHPAGASRTGARGNGATSRLSRCAQGQGSGSRGATSGKVRSPLDGDGRLSLPTGVGACHHQGIC